MIKLYLLRHGATPGNLKRQYIGATDQPLAPEGVAQARARAETLPPVERVWVSTMRRARETAELFYPDVPKTYLDGLREMDFGRCEEKTWEEINDPTIYDGWLAEDPNAAFPGGETLGAFTARLSEAMKEIARACQAERLSTCAVVAHGGVLMGLLSLYGLPKRSFFQWESENCGGFVGELDPEAMTITVLEQVGKGKIW